VAVVDHARVDVKVGHLVVARKSLGVWKALYARGVVRWLHRVQVSVASSGFASKVLLGIWQ